MKVKLFMVLLALAMVFAMACEDTKDALDGDADGDTPDGDLPSDCSTGEFACQGDDIYECNTDGEWTFYFSCSSQGNYVCRNGLCVQAGTVDGDTPDGDTPDGDNPDGDTPDGDDPDGDTPDGDTPDGDTPDGDTPDGDTPDGDTPDGDIPDPGEAGGACTFGPVNPNAGECGAGLDCIGAYADSSSTQPVSCSSNSDCEESFGARAVCASGYCGISWCTHSCTEGTAGDCNDMNVTGIGDACCGAVGTDSMCYIPEFCEQGTEPGDQGAGEACTFGAVNADAGNCGTGLGCIGFHANTSSSNPVACSVDSDCVETAGSVGVCAGGYCGVSWCAGDCSSDSDCDPSHGSGACCGDVGTDKMCYVPDFCEGTVEPGDRTAGQTCTFGNLYPSVGNCASGLDCIGMYADANSQQPTACSSDSDCSTALGDNLATCVSGYCGIAWCSGTCASNDDCSDAGYSQPACCGAVGSNQMCYRGSFCSAE